MSRVHGGFPQLMVVHLTQALVALDAALLREAVSCGLACGEELVALLIGVGEFMLGVRPFDAVERRHRDIGVSLFDQGAHVSEQEGEQERRNVLTVHIRVGHDDDLAVAELVEVEILADSRTESGNEGADGV